MEPLATAMTFATIVSLLASFKSEHKSVSDDEFQDFLEWLLETNHQEISELLEINTQATIGVKALLNKNSDELRDKFNRLDELLASIASNMEGFSQIALAVRPETELSEQALSVLRQLETKKATTMLQSMALGRAPMYVILDGGGGQLEYDDERFIEDDLLTLSELGLLRQDVASKGSMRFKITRNGAKLVALS